MNTRIGWTVFSAFAYKIPPTAWMRYNYLASKAGINKLYLVLSFDCDTQEDAKGVEALDSRLREIGIKPVYAVPGELLHQAASTYKELHQRGAEFINHGHTTHTFFNTNNKRYESCFFYDEIGEDAVKNDIIQGHQAIVDVLGCSPSGFRAPHFGCYQSPEQLTHLHTTLGTMGYRYSSSTLPRWSFNSGPAFREFGLWEFPVSGWWRQPMNIQDSWSYMAMPDRRFKSDDYLAHARETAEQFKRRGLCGILNYYADPSHVFDDPCFMKSVEAWAAVSESATYSEIVEDLNAA